MVGHSQNIPLKEKHEEGLEREAEIKLRRELDFIRDNEETLKVGL